MLNEHQVHRIISLLSRQNVGILISKREFYQGRRRLCRLGPEYIFRVD